VINTQTVLHVTYITVGCINAMHGMRHNKCISKSAGKANDESTGNNNGTKYLLMIVCFVCDCFNALDVAGLAVH